MRDTDAIKLRCKSAVAQRISCVSVAVDSSTLSLRGGASGTLTRVHRAAILKLGAMMSLVRLDASTALS